MAIEELITAFNEQTGIDDMAVSEGVWKYAADDMEFGVAADEGGERVFLFGEIPASYVENEASFRKTVLEANYLFNGTGGGTLSINPKNGAYTLVFAEWLDRLDNTSFFALVERFVNTLSTWKTIAEGAASAPSPASADDASHSEEIEASYNANFMRV